MELQENRLERAWAILTSLTQAHGPKAEICILQGAVLAKSGQYERALRCYEESLALAPNDSQAMVGAAVCLHMLGHIPQALRYYRSALERQCAEPLVALESRKTRLFDSAAAEQVLWEVLEQLADAGVHAFATAGTLLGLEREGRLLPFDKDLDIGVPYHEIQTARDLLLQSGWQLAVAPRGMINPIMLHNGRGLALDLCGFMADPESGATLGGFWLSDAPTDWQRVTWYPVLHLDKQPSAAGRMVWAVTNPQAWLAALYGPSWRVPDADFDTVIAAHNLRGFALLTQCYAFSRIYNSWIQGQLKKAASLVQHAVRHMPNDTLLLAVQQCLARQKNQTRLQGEPRRRRGRLSPAHYRGKERARE